MNEKQCVRCGRAGHDSDECKWLSVGVDVRNAFMSLGGDVYDEAIRAHHDGGGSVDVSAIVDRHIAKLPTVAAPQVATSAGLHLNHTQVAALREVLRISDRQHDAWDTLKAALKGGA